MCKEPTRWVSTVAWLTKILIEVKLKLMEDVISSQEDGVITTKKRREPHPGHISSIQQAGMPAR